MNPVPSLIAPGLDPKALARTITKAESPESIVPTLPAQSAYMALKALGVESASEIVPLLTKKQYQVALSFELWEDDTFKEDNFWNWLQAIDEEDSLLPLQQLISAIDLKLLSLIIARHAEVIIQDEPTDNPPGPLFFTPDRGYTWVYIKSENPQQYRLMGKLLAFLFESSAELFYQIISIPTVSTESELEESAYQDRTRQLSEESIPDADLAYKLHASLTIAEAKKNLTKATELSVLETIPVIEPLIFSNSNPDRVEELAQLLRNESQDEFQEELTLILNCAMIRFKVNFYEQEEAISLVAKVKGALNIGLEIADKQLNLDTLSAFQTLGLQKIYRLGLEPIFSLARISNRAGREFSSSSEIESATALIIQGAQSKFPEYPNFLNTDGTFREDNGKLISGFRPFSSIAETSIVRELLSRKLNN